MAIIDYFARSIAMDVDGSIVRNAEATVYALSDPTLTSPLSLLDLQGVPMIKLTAGSTGVYPPFRVVGDVRQVVAVSSGGGRELRTEITSLYGMLLDVVPDPEAFDQGIAEVRKTKQDVELARSEAVSAAEEASAVGTTNDTIMDGLIKTPTSKTAIALARMVAQNVGDKIEEAVVGLSPSTGFIVSRDPDGCLVIVAEPGPVPNPLTAPNLVSLVGGKNKATATFEAPSPLDPLAPVTDYRIRYRVQGETGWTYFSHAASDALIWEITGLGNGPANTYEVQGAAVNAGGISPYSNTRTVVPGAVNAVVFRDPAARTAAELVGSSPDLGPEAWTGSANQFEVVGGYISARAAASGALQAVGIGAHGLVRWEGVVNIDTQPAAASISTRLYVKLGAGTTDVAYLSINVNAAGTPSFTFTCIANGVTISNTFGMPAGAIPAQTAAADYAVLIEQTSAKTYVVTINGVTRTVTLASDPGETHANASRIGLTSNSSRVKHKIAGIRVNGYYN